MSEATGWQLDTPKLVGMLDSMRQIRGLSQRGLARELGVSPSFFTRLNQGGQPDADALVAICVWLHADLMTYVKRREVTSDPE